MKHSRRTFIKALLFLLVAPAACQVRKKTGPIVIGVRTSNCQTPFYVADTQGMYAAHGLDVGVQLVPSNTEIIEGMKRGDIQVGTLPVTTAIAAIAQGAPLHIVAGTGRGSDGILVRQEDGLESVRDLQGKRVATIRGSILDVLMRQMMDGVGMDSDHDTELSYFTSLGDMISALKTEQIDATSNTEPFMTDAERQGWGQILAYYTESWPDHPCCIVLARDEFVRKEPTAMREILAMHCEAVEWINTHIDEAAQIVVDYLGAFDRDLVARTLAPSVMRIDYSVQSGEIEHMADLMFIQGLIPKSPSSDQLVNLVPLEEALRYRQ